jgi:hypothetical protein
MPKLSACNASNPVFHIGQDAAHHRPAHVLTEGEHPLRLHERCHRLHLRMFRRLLRYALPVSQLTVATENLDM